MNPKLIIILEVVIWFFIMMATAMILCSCNCFHKPSTPIPDIPDTPQEILNKVVFKTNWLVAVSIIGAALAMAAFVNGSKAAIPIGIGSLTALGLTLATVRYAEWLAVGAIVAATLIFVATVIKKNVALRQIITGVQYLKEAVLRGDDPTRNDANSILADSQNKDTTKLVLNTKANLKLNGVI